MSALLLAPHHDDETLWAAFLCQTYRPFVVTVLQSVTQEAQGITNEQRQRETKAACSILGCEWTQWPEGDHEPDWSAIEAMMWNERENREWDRVFAPLPEQGGHDHHNQVGRIALEVFGDRVTFYTTYLFGGPRTVAGDPVPYTGEMLLNKLSALRCYESQILRGPRRFFAMALDEYVVKP